MGSYHLHQGSTSTGILCCRYTVSEQNTEVASHDMLLSSMQRRFKETRKQNLQVMRFRSKDQVPKREKSCDSLPEPSPALWPTVPAFIHAHRIFPLSFFPASLPALFPSAYSWICRNSKLMQPHCRSCLTAPAPNRRHSLRAGTRPYSNWSHGHQLSKHHRTDISTWEWQGLGEAVKYTDVSEYSFICRELSRSLFPPSCS